MIPTPDAATWKTPSPFAGDDGVFFEVHGWLVDVTVMEEKRRLVL